jgi:hypothetical protein
LQNSADDVYAQRTPGMAQKVLIRGPKETTQMLRHKDICPIVVLWFAPTPCPLRHSGKRRQLLQEAGISGVFSFAEANTSNFYAMLCIVLHIFAPVMVIANPSRPCN